MSKQLELAGFPVAQLRREHDGKLKMQLLVLAHLRVGQALEMQSRCAQGESHSDSQPIGHLLGKVLLA